jgi:hypothetical protein
MPTTRASASASAPPELPGLSAASVWMTSSMIRPGQAERIADRHHELADDEPVGLAELGRLRGRAVRAQHGQVGQRVGAHHSERDRRAVGKRRGAAARLADHVRVGEQEPVAGEDDT